jgi:hypothetical protein
MGYEVGGDLRVSEDKEDKQIKDGKGILAYASTVMDALSHKCSFQVNTIICSSPSDICV